MWRCPWFPILERKKGATGIAPMAPSIIFQLFFYMFIQLSQALLASVLGVRGKG